MKNNYEVRGDITAIFLNRKGEISETLISTEDFKLVNSFNGEWKVSHRTGSDEKYAYGSFDVTTVGSEKKKNRIITLHSFIFKVEKGKMVDHINHNTLDNTRINLREVTNSQNQQNIKGAKKNSKSGIRGVCWIEKCKSWKATVTVNGKFVYNKNFKNIKDAEIAVREARVKFHPYSTN